MLCDLGSEGSEEVRPPRPFQDRVFNPFASFFKVAEVDGARYVRICHGASYSDAVLFARDPTSMRAEHVILNIASTGTHTT